MSFISEYAQVVDNIVGVFQDSFLGFTLVKKRIETAQVKMVEEIERENPNKGRISKENFDETLFIYGDGDPNDRNSWLHRCTQGQLKERNSKGGINFTYIGNACLISIYQYWEDSYRAKIAIDLKIEKSELKGDIFGDIRLLRNSIVHHEGVALKEVENCKILRWFCEGEKIVINDEYFKMIVFAIQKQLDVYTEQYSEIITDP